VLQGNNLDNITFTSLRATPAKGNGTNRNNGTTSPSAKLDITGTNTANNLSLSVNGSLYVNSSGNVGIGTTSPVASSLDSTANKVLRIGGATLPTLVFSLTSSAQESEIIHDGGGLFFKIGGHATATNNYFSFWTEETNSQFTPTERLRIAADGTFTGSASNDISDARLKENVTAVEGALDKIMQLRGVSFNWKPEAKMTNRAQLGVIAQEVETVFPELVLNTSIFGEGYKSVQYGGFTAPFIEAIKELNTKVDTLKTENEALKMENAAMKKENSDMMKDLAGLKVDVQKLKISANGGK